MGIAEDKAVVRRYMQSVEAGEPDFSLLADELRWWVQGYGWLNKDQLCDLVRRTWEVKTPTRMEVNHVTAEDGRVSVESIGRATFKDGRDYENTYHFLFTVRDGRIVEGKEHFDTAYSLQFNNMMQI